MTNTQELKEKLAQKCYDANKIPYTLKKSDLKNLVRLTDLETKTYHKINPSEIQKGMSVGILQADGSFKRDFGYLQDVYYDKTSKELVAENNDFLLTTVNIDKEFYQLERMNGPIHQHAAGEENGRIDVSKMAEKNEIGNAEQLSIDGFER